MAAKLVSIDSSESQVSFSLKKLGFLNIKGSISDFQGNIVFDQDDLANSNFKASLGTITIDTGNPKRDEHLKSKDFFFVKEFPKISFESTEIQKGDNGFIALGNLTLLEETKEISIPFTHENGFLKGDFSLNRLEYDLGAKFPSFIVGKTVDISIKVKTTQAL